MSKLSLGARAWDLLMMRQCIKGKHWWKPSDGPLPVTCTHCEDEKRREEESKFLSDSAESSTESLLKVLNERNALRAELAAARTQLAVSGIVLPGWTCARCQCFNSAAKEWLKECRACGETGPVQP